MGAHGDWPTYLRDIDIIVLDGKMVFGAILRRLFVCLRVCSIFSAGADDIRISFNDATISAPRKPQS